LLSKV